MDGSSQPNVWASGAAYEPLMGRWGRLVAREFLAWLSIAPGSRWLDVGCGTGALSQTILSLTDPESVTGVDMSEGFINYAHAQTRSERASFIVGNAEALPLEDHSFDAVVSGLVLNFVPHPDRMIAEMARIARPGGTVATYIWDYAEKMQLLRYFWDGAIALDPAARELDEGPRFPICKPDPLNKLYTTAGLGSVLVCPIDVPAHFHDFNDYWSPLLGGQGPAGGYVQSLNEDRRARLREQIRSSLPLNADGSIDLTLRAWAVRGVKVDE